MGVGMGVTMAVTGTAAVAFFVTSLVFYGRASTAERKLTETQQTSNEIVKEAEKNQESIRLLIEEAKRPPARSLATYMQEQFGVIAEKVGGSRSDTPATLLTKVNRAAGSGNLLAALADRDAKIAQLQKTVADAETSRLAAVEQVQQTGKRIESLNSAQQAALAGLNTDVGNYKGQVDGFRSDLQTRVGEMASQIDKVREEADREKVQLNNELTKLREELLVAQGKIRELQKNRASEGVRPADEFALVDGEIIGLDSMDDRMVYLNIGRKQRVVIGMSFEVYSDATAMRPDESGEAPRGKASVEVIRLDENSSVARITRNPRGNPIARGDVIANPLFDPRKTYTFLVFGNFDPQNIGRSTPEGQSEIRALIEGWGGKVTDQLAGNVDFLVLGSRPVLPPRPPADAPAEVVQQFIRVQRLAREYDRLLEQAAATSIPVLNENRLNTLLGK